MTEKFDPEDENSSNPNQASYHRPQDTKALPPSGEGQQPKTIPPKPTNAAELITVPPNSPIPNNASIKTAKADLPRASETIQIPGYEILGELGRGGMGVVYKARHKQLNRVVALKMILAGGHASSDDLIRFLSEAEAVAAFSHPNIVQVHDIGQHNNLPFMALEFVSGGSLDNQLKDGPLPPKEASRLVEQMARGMNAAHQAGIVHRDLKPANVLLSDDGAPKVTDFGLAKKVEGGSGLTQTGAIMGTPSYMAPEQAGGDGKRVGPAADVYALGAILYSCLTGRPPFQADTVMNTLLEVISEEPVPVRQLNKCVPTDLETICLKGLQKDPKQRYGSAGELADDLQHFLAGEPITARRVSRWERAAKWAKRHPAVTGLTVFSLLATIIGFILVTWQWRVATSAQHATELARQGEANQRKKAEDALRNARFNLYVNRIALAKREWLAGNIKRMQELLKECPEEYRQWEWKYLNGLPHTDLFTFQGTTSPSQFQKIDYSSDGRFLAYPDKNNQITIRNLETGRITGTLQSEVAAFSNVAFSPDGKYLAAGDHGGQVVVWEWQKDKQVLAEEINGLPVSDVTFSPDGNWFAVSTAQPARTMWECKGAITVWNWRTKKQLPKTFNVSRRWINQIAFSPDSQIIVAATTNFAQSEGLAEAWSVPNGKRLPPFRGHQRMLHSVAFGPDGRHLATTSYDQTVKIWNVADRKVLHTLDRHRGPVTGVAFAPSGLRLATAGVDGTVRLWDVATGTLQDTIRGHTSPVLNLTFNSKATQVASVGILQDTDGTDTEIKIWDVTKPQETVTYPVMDRRLILNVALDPKGNRMAMAGFGAVMEMNMAKQKLRFGVPVVLSEPNTVAYSSGGEYLATRGADEEIKIIDSQGRIRFSLPANKTPLVHLEFSPDGRSLIACHGHFLKSKFGPVTLWDFANGRKIRKHQGRGAAFAPGGQRYAIGGKDKHVHVYSTHSGHEIMQLNGNEGSITCVKFSPDGHILAASRDDGTVQLWDIQTGQVIHTLKGHGGRVEQISFSQDGKRLASASLHIAASGRGELKLWDVLTGKEVFSLDGNACVCFGSDGRQLASVKTDFYVTQVVKIWRAESVTPETKAKHRAGARAAIKEWFHFHQARSAAEAKQWYGARFHHQRMLELQPREGHNELKATELQTWFLTALLSMALGDRDEYHRFCQRVLKRFGQTKAPNEAALVAWCCKVSPKALEDYTEPVRLAKFAVSKKPTSSFHHNQLGAILYRAGQYKEALKYLTRSLQLRRDGTPVWDWLWLAMTHHRLGNRKEAQKYFEDSTKWLNKMRNSPPIRLGWGSKLELQLLENEARRQIAGTIR